MTMLGVAKSEVTKLATAPSTWILSVVSVLGTWPLAWINAAAAVGLPSDDPRLYSSVPVPLSYQGFEMAGFGYVLVAVLAALSAGNEYGAGQQIRSTLVATPGRLRVFLVKVGVLAVAVALLSFLTMWGAIVINHVAGHTGLDPWMLLPAVWAHLSGVTVAWTLTALFSFGLGILARSAIVPLMLVIPLVVGVGDLLAELWSGAKMLPVVAGAALYNDPATGSYLEPATGGFVQTIWALAALSVAAVVFVRRDA